jgi:hypothetical protein
MKNIFKTIYKQIFNKSQKEEIEYIYNRNNENSLSFILDKDNNSVIQINVQHFDNDQYIDKFAQLLFMLNNGYYHKNIVDIMSDLAIKDPDRALFLSKVIQKWSHYIDKYVDAEEKVNDYNINKPCVSPLSFSKLVSQPNVQHEK